MHIPDGFLATPVWAALDAIAIPGVGYMARRAGNDSPEARVPLLGVLGAFVFGAQMINFPVAPGTSGHLLGAALLAYTVGPAAACVVMTAVLAIQAFVFQDGGILALGANVFNLAIAGVAAASVPYVLLSSGRLRSPAMFLGAALSVLVSAALALVEILLSGIRIPAAVLPAAAAFFLVSAVLEGAITVAVVGGIARLNPEWVRQPEHGDRKVLLALGAAAIVMASAGFLAASSAPDTLQSIAAQVGLAGESPAVMSSPFSGYRLSGIGSEALAKAAAGLAGIAAVYVVCVLIARRLPRRRRA